MKALDAKVDRHTLPALTASHAHVTYALALIWRTAVSMDCEDKVFVSSPGRAQCASRKVL